MWGGGRGGQQNEARGCVKQRSVSSVGGNQQQFTVYRVRLFNMRVIIFSPGPRRSHRLGASMARRRGEEGWGGREVGGGKGTEEREEEGEEG